MCKVFTGFRNYSWRAHESSYDCVLCVQVPPYCCIFMSVSHARRQTFEQLNRVVQSQLGRKVLCLHGGVAKTHRTKIIQEWEETSGAVLCAQLFIAGTGLNLQTMCNTAIFLLRWFNQPMESQVCMQQTKLMPV